MITPAAREPIHRAAALAEVVLFVGSILAFMWIVQPATERRVHLVFYALMLAFAWLSAAAHRETPRALGLRIDNALGAARLVLVPTLGVLLGLFAVGWAIGTRPELLPALLIVPRYFLWGLIQQYGLQAFVQRRLWNAGFDRRAPVTAALLFAVTHLPNPVLFALTFVAGWMWAAFYRRRANLFVLALSHALLAAVLVTALPASVTGGLRVGPGYRRHRSNPRATSVYAPRLTPDRVNRVRLTGTDIVSNNGHPEPR